MRRSAAGLRAWRQDGKSGRIGRRVPVAGPTCVRPMNQPPRLDESSMRRWIATVCRLSKPQHTKTQRRPNRECLPVGARNLAWIPVRWRNVPGFLTWSSSAAQVAACSSRPARQSSVLYSKPGVLCWWLGQVHLKNSAHDRVGMERHAASIACRQHHDAIVEERQSDAHAVPRRRTNGRSDTATQMVWHPRHRTPLRPLSQQRVETGELLLSVTRDCQADLLVMGAYGHAPWWESVFGGATREVLNKETFPILLAH